MILQEGNSMHKKNYKKNEVVICQETKKQKKKYLLDFTGLINIFAGAEKVLRLIFQKQIPFRINFQLKSPFNAPLQKHDIKIYHQLL